MQIAAGVDPAKLEIDGLVDMQVCKEQCVPQKVKFAARAATSAAAAKANELFALDNKLREINPPAPLDPATSTKGSFQADGSVVKITGRLEPADAKPGDRVHVSLTATPARGWHVYALSARDDQPGSKPTLIGLDGLWGLAAWPPETTDPITTDDSVKDFPPMHYHQGPVTWTIDVDIPADAEPGAYPLTGAIAYQACEFRPDGLGTCEIPKGARFTVSLNVGDNVGPAAAADSGQFTFTPVSYKAASAVGTAGPTSSTPSPPSPSARPQSNCRRPNKSPARPAPTPTTQRCQTSPPKTPTTSPASKSRSKRAVYGATWPWPLSAA